MDLREGTCVPSRHAALRNWPTRRDTRRSRVDLNQTYSARLGFQIVTLQLATLTDPPFQPSNRLTSPPETRQRTEVPLSESSIVIYARDSRATSRIHGSSPGDAEAPARRSASTRAAEIQRLICRSRSPIWHWLCHPQCLLVRVLLDCVLLGAGT